MLTKDRNHEWSPFIIAVILLGLAVIFPLIALVVVAVMG